MRVLDTSVTLAWPFPRQDPAEARLAEQALDELDNEESLVPALWYAEVANAILRGERAGLITAAQAMAFLGQLDAADIEADTQLQKHRQPAVLVLARTYALTAYDATYLELALRTGLSLATFDQKHAEATRRAGGIIFGDPT